MADKRRRPAYASRALVAKLAEAARAAGIEISRCGIEFTRDGTVRFVPPSAPANDLFERYKDQL
ncbi:MAG: hypothetical protein WCY11_02530 [Novosphingobium sp.]